MLQWHKEMYLNWPKNIRKKGWLVTKQWWYKVTRSASALHWVKTGLGIGGVAWERGGQVGWIADAATKAISRCMEFKRCETCSMWQPLIECTHCTENNAEEEDSCKFLQKWNEIKALQIATYRNSSPSNLCLDEVLNTFVRNPWYSQQKCLHVDEPIVRIFIATYHSSHESSAQSLTQIGINQWLETVQIVS